MIVLAYDGSDDARAAIDRAALLMPGAEATMSRARSSSRQPSSTRT
jgi:hypothetical protein